MILNHKKIRPFSHVAVQGVVNYTEAHMEKPKRGLRNGSLTLIIPVLFVILAVVLAPVAAARADEVQLKPDHPERYTVKKGDTLWDISSRFLKSPWHWPRVWKINDQIKNPHLIYPGDVILMRYVDGKPELSVLRNEKMPLAEAPPSDSALPPPAPGSSGRTDKLQPSVHVEPLGGAIPTISPNAIVPFLTHPLAVSERELEKAGYVTTGLDDRIALGDQSEFYARGVPGSEEYYQIFRPGAAIRDPDTKELLAYEAIYLGDAKKLEPGDPAKLVVTSVKQEIQPTDRLLAAPLRAALPFYFPSAPTKQVRGRIVTALNAVAEIGSYGIVGISLGKRDGIEEGHVLRVMRHVGTQRDPVTKGYYKLPDEESALVMVFRVYDKVSYALVMRSTRPVHLLDAVVTP
jgi:nucleoid-associated protein YgaU